MATPKPPSEDVALLRHLSGCARAFLQHFNPCDLAEDKAQQWQALEHQCDIADAAIQSAAATPPSADVDQIALDAATAICSLPESKHPVQHKAKIQCIIARAYLDCERLQEPSTPWRERWYGSEPQRGWSIMQGRELIAYIGGDESMSQAISEIVMKHNGDDKEDGAKRTIQSPGGGTEGGKCEMCFGTGRHKGRFGLNDASCSYCGGTGTKSDGGGTNGGNRPTFSCADWGLLDSMYSEYTPITVRASSAPSDPAQEPQAVAEVVSAHGDPEAFGERELVVLADLSKIPYGTKLYTRPVSLDREALARIIDPDAFEAWDRAEGIWRKDEAKVRCWPAEEKADAILALIEART